MSKEITKAFILQQMQDKFGLRELEPEIFSFLETVIPVYDITQHVQEMKGTFSEKPITSGPTGVYFYTVPQEEKWHLRGYNVVFMGAGAFTVTGVYIVRDGLTPIYLDMVLGQAVSYAVNLPAVIPLEPGDKIAIYIDSYTSTQNLRLYIDYMKEQLR